MGKGMDMAFCLDKSPIFATWLERTRLLLGREGLGSACPVAFSTAARPRALLAPMQAIFIVQDIGQPRSRAITAVETVDDAPLHDPHARAAARCRDARPRRRRRVKARPHAWADGSRSTAACQQRRYCRHCRPPRRAVGCGAMRRFAPESDRRPTQYGRRYA